MGVKLPGKGCPDEAADKWGRRLPPLLVFSRCTFGSNYSHEHVWIQIYQLCASEGCNFSSFQNCSSSVRLNEDCE